LLRIKKIKLIEEFNAEWEDLCTDGNVRFPLKMKNSYCPKLKDPSLRSG
jgi:hypothetical protein